MDPVPLDAELVQRFKDKTMAIVGYETDQESIYTVVVSHPLFISCNTIFSTGDEN